jgi:hypothetical protein
VPWADLDFEEAAGDRAVHERHAVGGAQAEVSGGRRVGGEDRRPPAAALRHEPIAEPSKEGARARQRQPLPVGRIRDHEPRLPLRPHLLEVPLRDRHRRVHAGRGGAGSSRLDGPRVEVAGGEVAAGRADAGLEFRDEPVGERPVAVPEAEEAVRSPPRPPQARGHARRDRGRLDHERARPAHRIEHRLAGGRGIRRRTRPPPAGDREDPGGEHLRQRRLHLSHPPAALVQRAARGVAEDRGHVAHEVQRQPERRPAELHARPLPARRPQLVHDRVLHDLGGVEGVGRERVVNGGVDPQRVGDLELLRPVDLLHRAVQGLGRVDAEPAERLEDADRRAAFEHGPVERLLLPARRRGELDRPPTDPQVVAADGLELPRQHPLQPLERPRGQSRRLVGHGRRQRPGRGER